MKSRCFYLLLILCAALLGCEGKREASPVASSTTAAPSSSLELPGPRRFAALHPTFQKYWYRGKAELTRYALRQARYGDIHDGEAILIFVTEDFLPKAQVKLERGEADDALSVLKLNVHRRFYTGIYPYNVMTSSFTPATPAGAGTIKLSSTVQEWCGQVYSQINRRSDGLHAVLHSYFQDDADQTLILPHAMLEDGMWAQIRIDPTGIKEGEREIVPGLHYIRLRHKALRAYPAIVTRKSNMKTDLVDHPIEALTVSYPPLARELVIYYEADFPHAILAWEENVGPQRTTAVRTNAIIDDYWNHNSVDDGAYREALGVAF